MADQIYKVRDPSGAIREIKGPAGASDDEILAQAQRLLSDQPQQEPLLTRTLKSGAKGLLRGGPLGMAMGVSAPSEELFNKFAYEAGGKVTDVTGSPSAGYAANVGMQAIPVLAAGGAGRLFSPTMQKGARSLMQSAIKPAISDLETGKASRAITTLLREGGAPNQATVTKLRGMTADIEREISHEIATSPATVNKGEVGKRLLDTWNKFKAQVNPDADLATIRKAWLEFRAHPDLAGKQQIPVDLAQQLKKGTYARLEDKAYGEVGTASKESQKALARGLREEIGTAVPKVVEPMARQAELSNAANVIRRRALMEGNKNPVGLGPMATTPAGFVTFLADRSAAIKAALARLLYTGRTAIPENTARAAAMLGVTPQATEE